MFRWNFKLSVNHVQNEYVFGSCLVFSPRALLLLHAVKQRTYWLVKDFIINLTKPQHTLDFPRLHSFLTGSTNM